eukprot:8322739-Alexandrium_andersonii.AAC.1
MGRAMPDPPGDVLTPRKRQPACIACVHALCGPRAQACLRGSRVRCLACRLHVSRKHAFRASRARCPRLLPAWLVRVRA